MAKAAGGKRPPRYFWLDKMMLDHAISPFAFRLSYVLVTKYRNEKTGLCCPSVDTLAKDLDVDEKTIRRAEKTLVDAGYFVVRRRGRGNSNQWWPSFDERTPLSGQTDDERTGMSDQDENIRSTPARWKLCSP